MKKSFPSTLKIFLIAVISVGLSSISWGEHHEGSGSKPSEGSGKKHTEGSGHKHSEGSGKKHAEGSGNHMDQEAMMAKWQEFATPNENHKALDGIVGSWTHTVKWWMSSEEEPEVSEGTSNIQWIMGGRFLQQSVEGTSMGQPFEGMGITGYDNAKKEYNSIWFDNMGTGLMIASGHYDSAAKTLTEKGTFTCPFRGTTPFHSKMTLKDNDNFIYEMFCPGFDGKEFRNMEIHYQRQK